LHAQYTGEEPCKALYGLLRTLPESENEFVELSMGFTAADVADCGPSVLAYGETQHRAEELADELISQFTLQEDAFNTQLLGPEQAVQQALAMKVQAVLADVQDNAGAGASSDTIGLLRALVDCKASNAVLGVICDAEICAQAHAVGEGGQFTGAMGGRTGLAGEVPFSGTFTVRAISDGVIAYTGAMYGGSIAEIGPSCLLSIENIEGDIRVVVSTDRTQCLDRALFTHFGVDPDQVPIVCVKSTVHHRADFETTDNKVLNVVAPGFFPCELDNIPYRKLRAGIRLGPNGPAFIPKGQL
jgi:microcystin degradation protein MlrC